MDLICSKCGQPMQIDDGCEPTRFCHYCAQKMVEGLIQEKERLLKIIHNQRNRIKQLKFDTFQTWSRR